MPSNQKQLEIKSDGVIVGIKDLSVGVLELDVSEIKNINDKEVFVSINKNISNKELDYLKKVLLELNKINIKGVIFYDLAIPNLKEELNLKYDLIWNQCHHTTNSKTALFWANYVEGVWISNDITLEEVNNTGVQVYTDFVLDGLKESLVLKNIDYFVLNGLDIENLEKVFELFKNLSEDNLESSKRELNKLIPNLGKGFLYQETIYRVKK